ncbi:c-type cytochrome [uncultured Dokdonia sp.]|uniref:c-type cytochrome n=1 Tax=uncultured Dokdonia sp. TaxID=575653 RepID=UPI002602A3F2|nr:c-type cytochrome [uncultured Dokdonia sp.]
MIQVKRQNSFSRILTLAAVVLLTLSSSLFAQDAPAADAKAGEALFKANCAACHKLYKPMTGPLLHQVSEKYDREWLYKWIKNSQGLIKSGDPLAVKVYEENGNKVMNSFPALSNADIDNILAYTDTPKPEAPVGVAPVGGADGNQGGGVSNNLILAILGFVLLLLVAVLFLVNNTLNKFASAQGIEMPVEEKRKPIWKAFVENQFLVLVSVIFLLLGSAYFAYGWMSQVGVDQGYMPVQPIHYSHRIHAGENAIECKYCHSSARVSKHSGIPSLNVCMNCHKSIAEVAGPESEFSSVTEDYSKEFYDKEIQKLYKAVGWDEATQSYTGETQAVEWVRIHNLPDFAYFNHSQHVSVAGIECQKCHGPVEEMEVMYQYAPLTMGWCINCHRETNVKIEGNAYYEEIHEQLAKKYGVEKVTAAQMGGLECGKCHY